MFYHANSDVISKPKYFPVLSYGLSKTVGGGNIGGREIQTGGHGPTDNKTSLCYFHFHFVMVLKITYIDIFIIFCPI